MGCTDKRSVRPALDRNPKAVDEAMSLAPNDTAYKRCSCHSGLKLLCKLCRTLPPPAMGDPIYRFLGMSAMRTRWMAGAAAHKSGDVETNPGPTTLNNKSGFMISAINKYMSESRYPSGATGLNTGCTSNVQVSAKHNTQIPGPAIYTENPDSHLTQT